MADLARAMRLSSIFRPRPGRLNLVDPAGIRAVISRIFGDRRFEDLDRELVVVSSSLTTGEHVVIRDGPIVDAIVASCSIPLVFPPVSRDGHHLLDGGLIDGLPIAVARGLGARRIVAVDASTHARHVLRLPGRPARHARRRPHPRSPPRRARTWTRCGSSRGCCTTRRSPGPPARRAADPPGFGPPLDAALPPLVGHGGPRPGRRRSRPTGPGEVPGQPGTGSRERRANSDAPDGS